MTQIFRNLKTAQKLGFGFGLCILLSAAVGGVAVSRLVQATQVSQNIISGSLEGVESLAQFNESIRRFRIAEYQHVTTPDKAGKADLEHEMAGEVADADASLQAYEKATADPVDRRNYEVLKTDWERYAATNAQFLLLSRAGRTKDGIALLGGAMDDQFGAVTDQRRLMAGWNRSHGAWYGREVQSAYRTGLAVILSLLSLSILIGTVVAVLITRYITGSLSQVSGRLEKLRSLCITNFAAAIRAMEGGDLVCGIVTGTQPLTLDSTDEFGAMARTFNAMLSQVEGTIASFRQSQASLSALVRGLQQSAAQVASASGMLASVSQSMGAGTEEISATMGEVSSASEQSARGASEIAQGSADQARALAESADLVKQLAAAVTGVARDAAGAGRAAEKADAAADQGNKAVTETMAGMARIRTTVTQSAEVIQALGQASSRIGGIVKTIDEIAAQTNLLALNAAIEAARAGDAGRGFAVVADEVRKLAERSSLATKEIGGLICDIQARTDEAIAAMDLGTRDVAEGTSLAEQAGGALLEIQGVVVELTRQVQGIGAAAAEMSASAEQVSRSINDVAAVVEESSAAAEEMSASAEQVSASIQTVASTTAQQSASVEQMVSSAENLSGIARSLDKAVAQFKIGDAPADVSAKSSSPALTLRRVA